MTVLERGALPSEFINFTWHACLRSCKIEYFLVPA